MDGLQRRNLTSWSRRRQLTSWSGLPSQVAKRNSCTATSKASHPILLPLCPSEGGQTQNGEISTPASNHGVGRSGGHGGTCGDAARLGSSARRFPLRLQLCPCRGSCTVVAAARPPIVRGHLLVWRVEIGFMVPRLRYSVLSVARHRQLRATSQKLEGAYCTPIQESSSCRSEFGFRVSAVAGSWHGHEQGRLMHFNGSWIADENGRAAPKVTPLEFRRWTSLVRPTSRCRLQVA
jgi:hypothetical protein